MHLNTTKAPTIAAAVASITTGDLASAGIISGRAVSRRTLSLDLPADKHTLATNGEAKPINRVKLTAHSDGTVDVRLIEVGMIGGVAAGPVTEHEITCRVAPAEVGSILASKIGLGAQHA